MSLAYEFAVEGVHELSWFEATLRSDPVVTIENDAMSAPGLNYIMLREYIPRERALFEKSLGFPARFGIVLCINDEEFDEHGSIGKSSALKLSMRILDHTSEDAALIFNCDNLLFSRIRGVLTLNSSWEWDEYHLALVKLPYLMAPLAY